MFCPEKQGPYGIHRGQEPWSRNRDNRGQESLVVWDFVVTEILRVLGIRTWYWFCYYIQANFVVQQALQTVC